MVIGVVMGVAIWVVIGVVMGGCGFVGVGDGLNSTCCVVLCSPLAPSKQVLMEGDIHQEPWSWVGCIALTCLLYTDLVNIQ